jgi:hypothetical protein
MILDGLRSSSPRPNFAPFAEAQTRRFMTVVSFGSSPPGPLGAFTKGLNESSYVQGRNLAIE